MAPNTAITDTGPGDAADVQTTMIEDVRNGDPAMDEWEVKQMNTHLEDGTVVMFAHLGGEKEGLGSKLLIPRPTTDPNDPLAWPLWQKYAQLVGICIFNFFGTCYVSGISTSFVQIGTEFQVTDPNAIPYLIAFPILMLGLAGFVWMPLAFKFGRRPVYLISTLQVLLCSIWSATSRSYGSLLASRIICATGASSVESIGVVSISEVFFLHQRGTYVAWNALWIFLGANLGPLLTGYIVDAGGWRAGVWFQVGIAALSFVLAIFCLQETVFQRSEQGKIGLPDPPEYRRTYPLETKKRSYLSTLKPFQKEAYSTKSFLGMFAMPFYFATFPLVWLSCIYAGVGAGASMSLVVASGALLVLPPYNFNSGAIGLVNLSPLIGTFIAVVVGGVCADKLAMWRTRRNKGVREPEMRLPLVWLSTLAAFGGLLLFGFGISKQLPWISEVIGIGMVGFELALSSALILTYVIDSYYSWALPCIAFVQAFKNVISCVLVMKTASWWEAQGVEAMFGTFGGIFMAVTVVFMTVIMWGPQIRNWQTKTRVFALLTDHPAYGA